MDDVSREFDKPNKVDVLESKLNSVVCQLNNEQVQRAVSDSYRMGLMTGVLIAAWFYCLYRLWVNASKRESGE